MMVTGIFSMFIADLAASAIFVGISLSIVEGEQRRQEAFRLGKALTLGIPAAALIGGIGTPLGNSSNMLVISMLEDGNRFSCDVFGLVHRQHTPRLR